MAVVKPVTNLYSAICASALLMTGQSSPGFAAEQANNAHEVVAHSVAAALAGALTVAVPALIVPTMVVPTPATQPAAAIAPTSDGQVFFPIGSKFSRAVQKVTGITFLSDVIAGQAAKKVLRKKLGGDVKVKVKTFGLTDLMAGKVKSVSVTSGGGAYRNIPIGDVKIATVNPVWYQYKRKDGEKPGLKSPLLLNVKGELRMQDIIVALGSDRIAQHMRGLKLDLPGLGEQQLQVMRPKVEIGENQLRVDAVLVTLGGAVETGVPITISGTPVLEGDKIYLRHMQIASPDIVEPEKFAAFAEELLNPIVDFSRLDKSDHAFRLKELAIKKDIVEGGGQLLIAPSQDRSVHQSQPVAK